MIKIIKILGLVFVLTFVFSCNQKTEHNSSAKRIVISGSSTMSHLVAHLALAFNQKNTNLQVVIHETGSGVGIDELKAGKDNIAMVSRDVKKLELSPNDYNLVQIAQDGIMPVVSEKVFHFVNALTLNQIKQIYSGQITNWNELGGLDQDIYVIDKIRTSGTRKVFMNQIFEDPNYDAVAVHEIAETTEEEVEMLQMSNSGIAFLSSVWIKGNIKALSLITEHGIISPIKENVDNKTYPIIRPLYLAFPKEVDDETKSFLTFIKSREGTKIIQKEGYSISYED